MTEHQAELQTELNLRIDGMDCADCALTLERGVSQMAGVRQVKVNFATGTLEAVGALDRAALTERITALGYRVVEPVGPASTTQPAATEQPAAAPAGIVEQHGLAGFWRYLLAGRVTRLALVGAAGLAVSALLMLWPSLHGLAAVMQGGVALLVGAPIAVRGLRALGWARRVTIDLLMSIAALGALLIHETGEAAAVVLLFALGEALEGYTAERARNALRSLLALKPEQATVMRPCVNCAEHLGQAGYMGGPCPFCARHERRLPVGEVGVGEHVLVHPGERIPVDGCVLLGTSSVNQAPITGESLPVVKAPGDSVYAGTVNGEANLELEVTRLADDTTLSRIVRLVAQAQAQRAPVERFIDRFAAWYTPAVVAAAVLAASLPPLLFGQPFFDTAGERGWLYRALAMLIVACPCALVISTPVTIVSALAGLARLGVLVKGGAFLDVLARLRTLAFDKTGTLTRGEPAVMQTHTPNCPADGQRCANCDEMLALATTVERRTAHPLARAILAEAETRAVGHQYPAAEAVQVLNGLGVQGQAGAAAVTVGSHTLFHTTNGYCEPLHAQIAAAEAQGQTVVLVSQAERLLGFVGLADVPRPDAQVALAALKSLDPTLRTVMLTGDNPTAAQQVAQQVGGIDEVRAGLLPEDKAAAVQALQAQYGPLAMVGDGVNDAPALATAALGIAMGGAGSAQAMETADLVLMQDDLRRLPLAVRASRQTRRIIWQNIVFSLAVKGLFLALTLPGWATLWLAVFADVGTALLVTFNGLRLLRLKER